jgi:hypothetical protein
MAAVWLSPLVAVLSRRVRLRSSPRVLCGGHCGAGTVLSSIISIFPVTNAPPVFHTSLQILIPYLWERRRVKSWEPSHKEM